MLRTALLSLILLVSLSSTSILKKSISRRQSGDPQYCHAIEGFECKCSYYRVTCTTDRDLPSTINILQNEQHKYQSVELVIKSPTNVNVNDQTFEPVKELYKPDGDNLEFRIKFEKFTALHLTSPGIFNRVFPTTIPANARKHMALEIYNPEVQPNDNVNLFQNLNIDSLELYGLYPFRGTFQQLFNGANINYLRLSGGDIRSDPSQTFTGNIGRLELAKQASALSVQNFPAYPAHELIINAFYITEFNPEHPPNYENLRELRVHSPDSIPANAFRNFPNIHTLSISTEKNIDPQALNGLNNLEKLTIKDTKPSLDLLKTVPQIKEFETNIEKLDDKTQCQLIDKLANGQIAIQSVPNGRECNCILAYLDSAAGRVPCDAEHCDHSSCAAIKNNYDASTRTFKAPPAIRRSDGSDALRQRESRTYTAPYQLTNQDQDKLQQGIPQPPPPQQQEEHRHDEGGQHPQPDTHYQWPEQPDQKGDSSVVDNSQDEKNNLPVVDNTQNSNDEESNFDYDNPLPPPVQVLPTTKEPSVHVVDNNSGTTTTTTITIAPLSADDDQHGEDGTDQGQQNEGSENQGTNEDNENRSEGDGNNQGDVYYPDASEIANTNGTETSTPPKKGLNWLPIIIIAAAIVGVLLIGLIILLLRKKRNNNKSYQEAPQSEPTGRS